MIKILAAIFCLQKMFGINKSADAMDDVMRNELERLKTFKHWPHLFIDAGILAKTGFYYSGLFDQVICQFCKLTLQYWQRGDGEVGEHRRFSPECDLLQRRDTSNVPLGPRFQLNELLSRDRYDGINADSRPALCGESIFYLASTAAAIAEDRDQPNACKICYAANFNVAFIPCGHVMACNNCAVHIANCPVCRQPIVRYLKIFIP